MWRGNADEMSVGVFRRAPPGHEHCNLTTFVKLVTNIISTFIG